MKALADSVAFLTVIEVLDLVCLVAWAAFEVFHHLRDNHRKDDK